MVQLETRRSFYQPQVFQAPENDIKYMQSKLNVSKEREVKSYLKRNKLSFLLKE